MSRIDEAFEKVDRRDFLPKDVRELWDHDRPLPIGYGQTNSQPSTVRRMLGWLDVQPGQSVLDIGSGSGWTSALLAYLVGKNGSVKAVELVPELVKMGRENCKNTGIINVTFFQASNQLGLPEFGPFDRILVSASALQFPDVLLDQLAGPGKLVVPVGDTIYEIFKTEDGQIDRVVHPGYVFVPLL